MQDACGDLVGAELVERPQDRFQRALHVGLDDQREILAARSLELRHHLLERAAHAGNAGRGVLALLVGAVAGDFAGAASRSPASGGPLKPSTSTGTDGPASSMVAP